MLPSLRKMGSYAMPGAREEMSYSLRAMAGKIRPHLRVQLLTLAVRMAGMSDAENAEALRHFENLCQLNSLSAPAQRTRNRDAERADILHFVKECCVRSACEIISG